MTTLQHLAWKGPTRRLAAHLASLGTTGLDAEDLAEALRHALVAASSERVDLLLAAGADPRRPGTEGDQVLAHAAIGGDTALVGRMLALGCDPNHANVNGRTPLIWAASFGRAEATRLLLAAGADPNAAPRTGYAPLLEALFNGRESEVPLTLITAGADVRARTADDQRTALHMAAGHGLLDVVKALLRRGADVEAAGGFQKERPLHAACRAGHTDVVRALLGAGADPEARDAEGGTALCRARPWDLDTIELLVDRAPALVHAEATGHTILDRAAAAGATEAVEFLLGRGARVQAETPGRRSALASAVIGVHAEVVRQLTHHPGVDLDYRWGTRERTALMTAAGVNGGEALALELLEAGTDPGIRDDDGKTVLHHAVQGAAVRLVDRILDLGLPVDDPCRGGWTPLMLAVGNGDANRPREDRVALVRLLLERGGDVHARDAAGRTPLHHLAPELGPEVARMLLDAGADIDATDDRGQTLLYLAAHHGNYDDRYRRPKSRKHDPLADLIEFLLARGADPNLPGPYGSPLCHASHLRCPEVVRMLRKHGATGRAPAPVKR